MQSVLLKIKSLPVCFCANLLIKACRLYFVFRADVDCDHHHLEQALYFFNHIYLLLRIPHVTPSANQIVFYHASRPQDEVSEEKPS